MANLYATQTHRGLQITWTGADLTGVALANIKAVFFRQSDRTRMVGTGTFSNVVVTPATATVAVSTTMNYTPSIQDVAVGSEGEWQIQVTATYADASTDISTLDTVTILPIL